MFNCVARKNWQCTRAFTNWYVNAGMLWCPNRFYAGLNFSSLVSQAMNVDGMGDAILNLKNLWNTTYSPASQYVCNSLNSWNQNMTAIYSSSSALQAQVNSTCVNSNASLTDNCALLTAELEALVQACVDANNSVTNVCLLYYCLFSMN